MIEEKEEYFEFDMVCALFLTESLSSSSLLICHLIVW
jgi:hypothetical protein